MVRSAGGPAHQILHHEGDPAEGPLFERALGALPRAVVERVDGGVELAVHFLEALDRGVDEFEGAHLAEADEFGLGGAVEGGEIVSHGVLLGASGWDPNDTPRARPPARHPARGTRRALGLPVRRSAAPRRRARPSPRRPP